MATITSQLTLLATLLLLSTPPARPSDHIKPLISAEPSSSLPDGGGLLPYHRVHVSNQLQTNSSMMIHCQSKDDDLGTHYIDDGKEYTWQFRPKVAFNITQFSCHVAPVRVARHVQFDAYVNNKFKIIEIKNNVYWKVKSDGVYISDPSAGMDYLRFKWASGANVA